MRKKRPRMGHLSTVYIGWLVGRVDQCLENLGTKKTKHFLDLSKSCQGIINNVVVVSVLVLYSNDTRYVPTFLLLDGSKGQKLRIKRRSVFWILKSFMILGKEMIEPNQFIKLLWVIHYLDLFFMTRLLFLSLSLSLSSLSLSFLPSFKFLI